MYFCPSYSSCHLLIDKRVHDNTSLNDGSLLNLTHAEEPVNKGHDTRYNEYDTLFDLEYCDSDFNFRKRRECAYRFSSIGEVLTGDGNSPQALGSNWVGRL